MREFIGIAPFSTLLCQAARPFSSLNSVTTSSPSPTVRRIIEIANLSRPVAPLCGLARAGKLNQQRLQAGQVPQTSRHLCLVPLVPSSLPRALRRTICQQCSTVRACLAPVNQPSRNRAGLWAGAQLNERQHTSRPASEQARSTVLDSNSSLVLHCSASDRDHHPSCASFARKPNLTLPFTATASTTSISTRSIVRK